VTARVDVHCIASTKNTSMLADVAGVNSRVPSSR
jgi:hypothetical protein